jgi:predicted nucleic-acid-binding protein
MANPWDHLHKASLSKYLYRNQRNNNGKLHVSFLRRSVDDTFTLSHSEKTTREPTTEVYSNLHCAKKFTVEVGEENEINYSDLAVHRKTKRLNLGCLGNLNSYREVVPFDCNPSS